jgi:hypothetical protein
LWANTDAVNNALEYLKFSIPGASSHDNIVREINEVLFVDKNLDIYIKRTLLQKNKKSEESLTDVDDIYELIKFNT